MRNALLIGIQDYGVGVGSMGSAPKDVDALNDVLSNADVGYFHATHVVKDEVVCTEPGQKPVSSAELATMIQVWCRNHEPDDLALLYWSGQGFRDQNGTLYLAASDTRLESDGLIDSAAIPVYSLTQWLNQSSAREQVIILDCCFRDRMGQALDADDEALNFQTLLEDLTLAAGLRNPSTSFHNGGGQRVLMSACRTANYFSEQKSDRLSLYTRYWIEGVMTGAADKDEKQWVSVADIHRYVEQQMQVALPNIKPLLLDPEGIAATIRVGKVRLPLVHRQYRQAIQNVAELSPNSTIGNDHSMGSASALPQPISPVGHQILDIQRHKWGLSSECAQIIEQQVIHPLEHYGNSLNNYREVMANLLDGRVFNEQVGQRLQDQRRRLGLRPQDVETINHELTYLQKLRHGQQYRKALKRAIATENVFPFDTPISNSYRVSDQGAVSQNMTERTRQELSILKTMLDLSDEDITLIEQDVMAERTTHHQRLAHYRQRYIQALSQGIALSPLVREELDILQQYLDLSKEDVERVEWLVKQGHLQPLTFPADPLSSPQSSSPQSSSPQSSSPQPKQPTAHPLRPQSPPSGDTGVSAQSPSPDKFPMPQKANSTDTIPPGALPLTPQIIQPIESDAASHNSTSVDETGSEAPPPTLFSLSSSDPTVLSTAPVFPTPLGAPFTTPGNNEKTNAVQSPTQNPIAPEPLSKGIERYETAFLSAIARQFPVSERDRQTLHHLQHMLELSDNQVRLINQRIVDRVNQKEAYYHHTKIQDYAQQFVAFMEQEWPLSQAQRAELSQLQQQLELHDADVHVLEQQLEAQHRAKTTVQQPADSLSANPPLKAQDPLVTELIPSSGETDETGSETAASASSQPLGNGQAATQMKEIVSPEPIDPNTASQQSVHQSPVTQSQDDLGQISANQNSSAGEAVNQWLKAESSFSSSPTSKPPTIEPVQEKQDLLQTELEAHDNFDESQSTLAPEQDIKPQGMGIGTAPVQLLTDREVDYGQLETYLRHQDWKKADEETLDMMLKATARRVKWLDRQAISELPCTDIRTIDALWSKYSQGRFGFRVQQDIFKATQASNSNVARFGQQVGWTIWQSKWVGFKYYQQLNFDLKAPAGHLPAKWFWMVPWWESVRSGGLGGRGGCGGDASEMLAAMMLYQFLD